MLLICVKKRLIIQYIAQQVDIRTFFLCIKPHFFKTFVMKHMPKIAEKNNFFVNLLITLKISVLKTCKYYRSIAIYLSNFIEKYKKCLCYHFKQKMRFILNIWRLFLREKLWKFVYNIPSFMVKLQGFHFFFFQFYVAHCCAYAWMTLFIVHNSQLVYIIGLIFR